MVLTLSIILCATVGYLGYSVALLEANQKGGEMEKLLKQFADAGHTKGQIEIQHGGVWLTLDGLISKVWIPFDQE